jgi:hypothetical protein
MITKFCIWALLVALTACGAVTVVPPEQSLTTAAAAWGANQHTVWDIEWDNVPLSGAVSAEIWRAGKRLRIEILEAPAGLLGQTLVVNDGQARQFDRLSSQAPVILEEPLLPPVTDALELIDSLLADSPAASTTATVVVSSARAERISLNYANGDTLAFYLAADTGLPLRIEFSVGGQTGRLTARSAALLPDPLPGLFAVE